MEGTRLAMERLKQHAACTSSLVSPTATRTVHHQSDFGAFFEWLRNASLGSEFEALKDKARSYIFRTGKSAPSKLGSCVEF